MSIQGSYSKVSFIGENQYCLKKVKEKQSALSTLNDIEKVMKNQLIDSTSPNDLRYEQLREKAHDIHVKYFNKTIQLSFFRWFFGGVFLKEMKVQAYVDRIDRLADSPLDALKRLVEAKQIPEEYCVRIKGGVLDLEGTFNNIKNNEAVKELGGALLLTYSKRGDREICEFLVRLGVDINAVSANGGYTPLMLATRKGHFEIVELLANHGADMNALSDTKKTALIYALYTRNWKIFPLLVEKGALDLPVTKHQITPLIWAVKKGNLPLVNYLIRTCNPKINHKDHKGMTALHYAAERGQREIVSLLLENGADVNSLSGAGYPPLMYALYTHDSRLVTALIRGGAFLDFSMPENDETPLIFVARTRDRALLAILQIQETVRRSINMQDTFGNTALHHAVAWGDCITANVLIFMNAGLDIQNQKDLRPCDIFDGVEAKIPSSGDKRHLAYWMRLSFSQEG